MAAAPSYDMLAIAAVLEVTTDRRWDAMQSWVVQAVAIVQDAIAKAMQSPSGWEGQRVVAVTGGQITSSSSASRAKLDFYVLVPAVANLTVHTRRLQAADFDTSPNIAEHSRRLVAAAVSNATYNARVRSWANLIEGLGDSTQFNEDIMEEMVAGLLPVPPGMSLHSYTLGVQPYHKMERSNQPSFVFSVDSAAPPEPPAIAGSMPSGRMAGTLLPVVLVVFLLSACIFSRMRCVRQRLENLCGLLQDKALKTGVLRVAVEALEELPFTPSPTKTGKFHSQFGDDSASKKLGMDDSGTRSGTRQTGSGSKPSGGAGSGSRGRPSESCRSGSGSRGPSEDSLQGGGSEYCDSMTANIGSYISDDIEVCSFTSSQSGSPMRAMPRSIASPEVKTPFKRSSPERSESIMSIGRQTVSSFSLEDLSPGLYGNESQGVNPESIAPRLPIESNSAGQEGLNSILAVRPPQPPRHKYRPKAVGPPLREALDELAEPPPEMENSWRLGEWISFSPLRRVLRGRNSDYSSTPSRNQAATLRAEMGLSPPKFSPEQIGETPEEIVSHSHMVSPARRRGGRGRPRALDGELFAEAQAAERSQLSRSAASTPHRDTCLQVAPTPCRESPSNIPELEWTGNEQEWMAATPGNEAPYEWRPTCRWSSRPSPTSLTFTAADSATPGVSSDLPQRVVHDISLARPRTSQNNVS